MSIAPTEIAWVSSDLKVARIGLDGTVLAAAPGTAQITAQWHGMKGAATVTVLSNEPLSGPCPKRALAAVGASALPISKCGAR
jgi:uncharacterized protein YjdB